MPLVDTVDTLRAELGLCFFCVLHEKQPEEGLHSIHSIHTVAWEDATE